MATNTPQPSIWTFQDNFDFRVDIDEAHPFYVPLEAHRGDYSRRDMLNQFQLDASGSLLPGVSPKVHATILFGGHVGGGKSTELRKLGGLFQNSYTVSHLELTKVLDINNLRFSDLLIALAQRIVDALVVNSLTPNPLFVKPLTEWFETRIIKQDQFKDLDMEVKTQASGQVDIPFLAKFLAVFTAKIKTGASYREELRKEVRDGFTVLAQSLNALIAHANDLLKAKGKGPLLFIVDGTDKLKREDSTSFFQSDVNQLGQIQTNLILCAPIAVLLEEGGTAQRFGLRLRLPMVKIYGRDEAENESAVTALVNLVGKRIPLSFFDYIETVRYLVRKSGGHPRDLLRLVRACFSKIDAAPITLAVAQRAVRDIAAEYQRSVQSDDWAELVRVDASLGEDTNRTEARLRMLYDLVLLEYNNYWWRSHPLVREIAGYARAKSEFEYQASQAGNASNSGNLPPILLATS
jgi:hypothetical protein